MAKSIQLQYLQEDGSYELLYPYSYTQVAMTTAFTRINYIGTGVLNEASFEWDQTALLNPPKNLNTMYIITGHESASSDSFVDIYIGCSTRQGGNDLVILSTKSSSSLITVKYAYSNLKYQGNNIYAISFSGISENNLSDQEKIRASMNSSATYNVFLLGVKEYVNVMPKAYNTIVNKNINAT